MSFKINITRLNPQQQKVIYEQRKKRDVLKQQLRQLQHNVMQLKHKNKQQQQVIKQLTANLQSPQYGQIIQNRYLAINNILDLIQQKLNQQQQISDELIQVEKQINFLNRQNDQHQYFIKEKQIINKMLIQQIQIYQTQNKKEQSLIKQIQQENFHIRPRTLSQQQKEAKKQTFIDKINQSYPNVLAQTQYQKIKDVKLSQLTIQLLSQIQAKEKFLQEMKQQINKQKTQYIQTQSKIVNQQQVYQQQQRLIRQNYQLTNQLNNQVQQHDNLDQNMKYIVKEQLSQKQNRLNKTHYQQTIKYIITAEYLITRFHKMMSSQEKEDFQRQLAQARDTVKNIVDSTSEQFN